jgi:hypothetical protein
MIKVNIDARGLKAAGDKLGAFSGRERGIAINTGLKKIVAQGATVGKRAITAEYNVKTAEVGRRMHITYDKGKLQAAILARPRKHAKGPGSNRIPLIDFSARDTKKTGVKFKIRKGSGQAKLRHAFIATMKNGHKGVYMRVPGTKKIREVFGIDVPHMFSGPRVKPKVLARVLDVAPRVLLHELEYRLRRLGFR